MATVNTTEQRHRDEIVRIVRDTPAGTFNPRFPDWLLVNWATWLEFERAANAVRAKGFTSYSAYVIVNVLRWQANIRGIKFAMSNTLIPDLGRLYNLLHPRPALFTTSTRFGKETTCSSAT